MGIQINGQTDTISAGDGGLVISGQELNNVTDISASGIGTFGSGVVLTGGDITLGTGTTISSPASDTFIVSTNGSERLRVDSSGRLGIGTISAESIYYNISTPYTPGVQIKGSYPQGGLAINCTNDAAQLWLVNSQNSTTSDRGYGAITFLGYNSTDNKYQTAARIDGIADATTGSDDMPGRLVFSTTADGASSPTERMRIGKDGEIASFGTNTTCFGSRSNAAAGSTYSLFVGAHSANNTYDGTVSFNVTTDGNVTNTNNSYGAISDIKLKENIVDANSQWDDLKALQVRNYNFKEGQTHTQIGLIAQEVELVSPGLVSESPDRDEEGNDLGTVTKSVNYSVLYMKAVKALQEAMERIETLEAKVAALETP